MVKDILESHHQDLRLGEGEYIRLCIMFAFGDSDSDEAPVKFHGYPAAGVISVIPYKQRVDKRADAEIILDQGQWRNLTDRRQRALLDHLITHLEFAKDKDENIKTDDIGRPKLELKLCDWFLRGFRSIAERYGDDALETIAAEKFQKEFGDVTAGAKLFA